MEKNQLNVITTSLIKKTIDLEILNKKQNKKFKKYCAVTSPENYTRNQKKNINNTIHKMKRKQQYTLKTPYITQNIKRSQYECIQSICTRINRRCSLADSNYRLYGKNLNG